MEESWWRDDAIAWTAGAWSIELRGDELADIRHSGRLILRGVRVAVRDHSWLTVPVDVEARQLDDTSVLLRLRHTGLGAHLSSTLTATVEGAVLRISWDAQNLAPFDTNRTGLVALHPASDAGTPVTVIHGDGTTEPTVLPRDVRPHQPILDIRELGIGGEGARATLRFEGDVFEMEDQRNWTDASFKTYSRPLGLPFPYSLPAGERLRQSITIRIDDGIAPASPSSAEPVILREAGAFPEIGVEASTAPEPVPACSDGTFRVVELNLITPAWPAALSRAAADGLPLDVRLVTDGEPGPLQAAAAALAAHDVVRVMPFDAELHVSDATTVAATRAALAGTGVAAPVVGGARSHFTELNRERHRLPEDLNGIAFTMTPLFHTLDTEQLVEAVAIQRTLATQAVEMAAGVPVHIGPVSLRPRFNNVATTPEPGPTRTDLSEGYGAEFTGAADDRQAARELAAWVIGSAAALAIPGVASLSWFETWGPRGLRNASGSTAAADAVEALASLAGAGLLTGDSPDGLIWAIGARTAKGVVVLVANLDRSDRRFTLRLPGDATEPVALDAGAWARITIAD